MVVFNLATFAALRQSNQRFVGGIRVLFPHWLESLIRIECATLGHFGGHAGGRFLMFN
jgi:hypothetical protein